MSKDDRQSLRATIERVSQWTAAATTMRTQRESVDEAANLAEDVLCAPLRVERDGRAAWKVVALRPSSLPHLQALAKRNHLRPLTRAQQADLAALEKDVPQAISAAGSLLGVRRIFAGKERKHAAAEAAEFLTTFEAWGVDKDLPNVIESLKPSWTGAADIKLTDALSDDVGLRQKLDRLGVLELTDAIPVHGLLDAINTIDRAVKDEEVYRKAATDAGHAVRRAETRQLLATMGVDRLREVTADRIATTPLLKAGIRTVLDVIDSRTRLEQLPGIGEVGAKRIRGAARTIEQTTYDEMPARIDLKNRTSAATTFLAKLGAWDAARRLKNATSDLARAQELADLALTVTKDHTHLVVASIRPFDVTELLNGVNAVIARAARLASDRPRAGTPAANPWDDFLARPADYFGMLTELGFLTEDEDKAHGDLPEEVVEAVRALSLNTEYLTVSTLRGYQSFAARFALVQRKVIIGDEMGLGKTVEALTVLTHLRGVGANTRFVVVCPAAVVTNWMREIATKTTLQAHRLHGRDRDGAVRNWRRDGGVAVTTFETLPWFKDHFDAVDAIGCVVVDEAHYIKNPAAKRSIMTASLMRKSDRAIFLTGTPLENRIDEFANLVRYLQPQLVVNTDGLAPLRFRQQVAPAYLRRNQEDVLTELPELVEVDETVSFSTADRQAYHRAVEDGNFMAMRQAAMLTGHQSAKVQRLKELVAEAEANGRKVIVFSHFRAVLDLVARELPGDVHGPLTGSVAAAERQRMVDRFSAAGHGAVLVSQIVAGGVGLNIQAASVVIICEPQLKPTTEWQAIARARRMGQLESVQVHRLISEEGVDQRVTEILARKSAIFDDFARLSTTADSAPEAFDVSEAELARQVVEAERERLFSAPPTPDDADDIAA